MMMESFIFKGFTLGKGYDTAQDGGDQRN